MEAWEAKEPNSKHEIRYQPRSRAPTILTGLLESGERRVGGYAAEPRARRREPGEDVRRSDRGGKDVVSGPRGTLGTAGVHRER